MNCRTVRDMLDSFVRGRLDKTIEAEVRRHLKDCPDCRAEAEFLTKYFKAMDSIPKAKAPADLLFKVRARLSGGSGRVSRPFIPGNWRIPLGTLGLLATAALAVIIVFPRFVPQKPAPRLSSEQFPVAAEKKEPPGGIVSRDRIPTVQYAARRSARSPAASRADRPVTVTNGFQGYGPGFIASVEETEIVVSLLPRDEPPARESPSAMEDEDLKAADGTVERKAEMNSDVRKKTKSAAPAAPEYVLSANGSASSVPDDRRCVRNTVTALGAKIINDTDAFLTVDLAGKDYGLLLARLRNCAKITQSASLPANPSTLRIKLKYFSR